MSDDNPMEVDMALLPSPMSSSSLPLPQAEVDEFKKQMLRTSEREHWSSRAGNDKEEPKNLLTSVLTNCLWIVSHTALKKHVIDLRPEDIDKLVESLNDDEVEEWKNMVQKGDWEGLITHPKLEKPAEDMVVDEQAKTILFNHNNRLGDAYKRDFIGDFATEFIKHLELADLADERDEGRPLYAKAISVVQSSGTGKSRMLTEVGKQIFTLPICLRKPSDPGYPPGDEPVVDFFSTLPQNNDLSFTAHSAIACFLAAAHEIMLETLQDAYDGDGPRLLEHWNGLMESTGARGPREEFFTKVVERANTLRSGVKAFRPDLFKNSPIRQKDDKIPDKEKPLNFEPNAMSSYCYKQCTKKATEKLMEFLSNVLPGAISVMYFDEAHELGSHYWIFLRLIQHQSSFIKMWYTFMGTKSRTSCYTPPPSELLSARLKQEVARLLPPYIDLGFDQRVIAKSRAPVTVCMGDMESIEFISQYGRPMWSAHLPEVLEDEIIYMASFKLRNGEPFNVKNKDHVFAVLSQRLCLDLVLSTSEAIKLADRSVGHHMRLLTGVSTNSDGFYTHSPSEPVLVMGSIHILYNTQRDLLGQVLNTLSQHLCGAGLVEKGILGELGARTLLLVARDFAVRRRLESQEPRHSLRNNVRNFLKPVPLLDFLDTLFGRNIFTPSDRLKFGNAFGKAYVNFTHWISTRDSIPDNPDQQRLANLWARGAGIQCCFSQESMDLLIPSYHGSIAPDSKFDPSLLSVLVIQVKNKIAGDLGAEIALRPIGVFRDPTEPLPYLAILMELGNERHYKETGKRTKYTVAEPLVKGKFGLLCDARDAAVAKLDGYPNQKNTNENILKNYDNKAKEARLAVNSYNRYSISARGVSPDVYDILNTANIAKEFATLLSIIIPSSAAEQRTREHMRPLERLSAHHTDWIWEYGVSNEEWRWSP